MSPLAADAGVASSPYKTATFLLEIGTEELPSGSVAPALEQLQAALATRLEAERLAGDSCRVDTLGTPRRLTLIARGVLRRQSDQEAEARGPAVKAAFDAEGRPTRAAEGFAARQGIPVTALEVVGDYVVARTLRPGRDAGDVLAEIVADLLKTVTFSKFMRWGAGNYRFGRPLRRFVALLDAEVVPFTVDGISSGRETVGHRFLFDNGVVAIQSPDTYVSQLRAAFVEPDPEARRSKIIAHARALAASVGGRAVLPDALVEENVYLTEWTTGVLGTFNDEYLSLPRPVLETAMRKHQRFFPVENVGQALLPFFIAIRSGGDQHLWTVRSGYENVLGSRFSDAKFFFDHDRQTSLSDKAPRMERIVFQEKLGTLADKTARLGTILEATGLAAWTREAEAARRAAQLAKIDLATEIVKELPALQGVMGREFARLDGESASVGEALYEQYLPRTAGDAFPVTRVGTALALADRADTLVGYMRFVGAEPKGSSDPFGLKRAASAIVDILARDRRLPSLSMLLRETTEAYVGQGRESAAREGDILALVEQRLRGILEDSEFIVRLAGERDRAGYDLVDAILSAPWDNIADVVARAEALATNAYSGDGPAIVQAATRARNLLRSAKESIPTWMPEESELTEAPERALRIAVRAVGPEVRSAVLEGDFVGAFGALQPLTPTINHFFDGVMVMADESAVRRNRLALLGAADRLYLSLADFSKLTVE